MYMSWNTTWIFDTIYIKYVSPYVWVQYFEVVAYFSSGLMILLGWLFRKKLQRMVSLWRDKLMLILNTFPLRVYNKNKFKVK